MWPCPVELVPQAVNGVSPKPVRVPVLAHTHVSLFVEQELFDPDHRPMNAWAPSSSSKSASDWNWVSIVARFTAWFGVTLDPKSLHACSALYQVLAEVKCTKHELFDCSQVCCAVPGLSSDLLSATLLSVCLW